MNIIVPPIPSSIVDRPVHEEHSDGDGVEGGSGGGESGGTAVLTARSKSAAALIPIGLQKNRVRTVKRTREFLL